MNKEISCGIIPVFRKNDEDIEFLLIQHHSGHWGFPKGHQNVGETYLETATREFFEETGLHYVSIVSEIPLIHSYTPMKKGILIHKDVYYFTGFVDSQHVIKQDEEIKDFFWGNKKDVLNKITHQSLKGLFKAALAEID